MAKKEAMKQQEVTVRKDTALAAVPEYLRGQSAASSNMTADDMVIPRIKLIQAISPEIDKFEAKPGTFWHNIENMPFGDGTTFAFAVCRSRKMFNIFAPRNDPQGRIILARAPDGVHWDSPEAVIKMKPKGAAKELEYMLAPTVAMSKLDKFGTLLYPPPHSVPADAMNTPPAATATYEYLVYPVSNPEYGPMVMWLARSQVKQGKVINSSIEQANLQGIKSTGVKFVAEVTKEQGPEGPYFNWQFRRAGYLEAAEAIRAEQIAMKYASADYRAADSTADDVTGSTGPVDEPKKGF